MLSSLACGEAAPSLAHSLLHRPNCTSVQKLSVRIRRMSPRMCLRVSVYPQNQTSLMMLLLFLLPSMYTDGHSYAIHLTEQDSEVLF